MKYFYDFEFYEDGRQIHPISVGIVAEDERELYFENAQFDWGIVPAGHWLWENVYPHLSSGTDFQRSRKGLADEVQNFICNNPSDWRENKLYGYYVAYDHVVLAQLFGRMVDMPYGMPWFSNDLKQMIEADPQRLGNVADTIKYEGTQHHALTDARWNKDLYEKIIDWSRGLY